MAKIRPRLRGGLFVLAAFAAPALLSGCFAMQQDLDPIRSDISVLEKQFMEIQRDARKRGADTDAMPGRMDTAAPSPETPGTRGNIAELERRLSRLENRVEELSRNQQALSPQPMAPEPVMIEPMEEEAPPAPSAPGMPMAPAAPPAAPPVPEAPILPSPAAPAGQAMPAEKLYNEAITAFKAGDLAKAEAGFTGFLGSYPTDRLADNARYWLGETYFSRNDYMRALGEYERVVKDYPVGDKVPDAVFKMGVTYEKLGQKEDARTAYTRVMDNYPYSDSAKMARQRLDNLN